MEWIKKYWLVIVIILVLPICVNFILLIPAFSPIVGKDTDWLSFLGGYLGSIISAGVAFIILVIQYKQNQKENKANRQLQINAIKHQQELNQLHNIINTSAKLISVTNPYKAIDICKKIGMNDINVIELFENLSLNIETHKVELEIYINTDPKLDNKKLALDVDSYVFEIKMVLMDMQNIVSIFNSHHGNLYTIHLTNGTMLGQCFSEQTHCIITQYENISKKALDYTDCRSITLTMVKEIQKRQYDMQNNILGYIKQEQERIDKILTDNIN